MAFQSLDNCPRCGKVFVKGIQAICPACNKEVEVEYEKCAEFLRQEENRGCSTNELSDGTGVSVRQITQFIREGRISVKNHPNLGLPCEACGTLIQSGHLCNDCAKKFNKQMEGLFSNQNTETDEPQKDSGGKGYQVRDVFKRS